MFARVVGIGNSAGIVIPSALMNSLGLKKNDKVTIEEMADGFVVRKEAEPPKSFEALLADFYGTTAEQALRQFCGEADDVSIDWGELRGEEIGS